MEDSQPYFSPRLIDYIAIVGHPHPTDDSELPLQPEILRRYPVEDHADFTLPPDTAFFCQPEGCTTIGAKHMTFRDTQSFVFALTDKDSGRRRYGTCLNFYRPFKRKYQRNRKLVHQHSADSNSSNEDHPSPSTNNNRRMNAMRSHTLTSLCILSHHSMFSTFRECLNVLRKLIESCSSHAAQSRNGRKLRNVIWKFLIGRTKARSDSAVLHIIRQLETWIFRLLSAPVPVPGKTRLELYILPETVASPLILALPDTTRFSLVDFPLHLPLELLGVDKCIQALLCIILEQKVILMSRDYNALTMSVLALVAMLYPLEYMFPVIPLLPASLEGSEQLLFAPTPYLIGLPTSFGQTRRTCLPNDVWLFDLDSDTVTAPPGPGGQLPVLPEPECTMLKTHLKQSLTSLSMSPQPIKNLDVLLSQNSDNHVSTSQPANQQPGFNPFIYGTDVDSVDIATRVAMVRFFASPNVLGHITEHTRILRLYPRPVVGFQINSFIRSRPSRTLFVCKLASTQAVEYFTEWALSPTNVVYMRVQTGIYDPAQIGDKPRWYAHHLSKIEYKVLDSPTSILFNPPSIAHRRDSQESTSDGPTSDSSDVENHSQITTVQVSSVFTPPTEVHKGDPLYAPSSSSESSSPTVSCASSDAEDGPDVVELRQDENSENKARAREENGEEQGDTRVQPKPAPRSRPPRPPPIKSSSRMGSTESGGLPSSPAALIQTLGSDIGEATKTATSKFSELLNDTFKVDLKLDKNHLSPSPAHKPNPSKQEVPILDHTSTGTRHKSNTSDMKTSDPSSHVTAVHAENQVFLKDVVSHILEGQGVGWLRSSKIRKLMEDENYRNFVLSRLNTQLDRKFRNHEQLIEDIQISRSVYKGMVTMLKLIVQGLEHTFKTNSPGGMASALMVLEIAASHFISKEGKSNNSSRASSPFGSRESLASTVRQGQNTPTKRSDMEASKSSSGASSPTARKVPEKLPRASKTKGADGADSGVEGMSDSNDEDIMHKLVTNKELLGREPPALHLQGVAIGNNLGGQSSPSAHSPISYQPLKRLSTSGKTSPTNSEQSSGHVDWLSQLSDAISNYSQTVALQSGTDPSELPNKASLTSASRTSEGRHSSPASDETVTAPRIYVFEALIGKDRSQLWDQMQFWEDVFLDGVAQERDIIGLDQEPSALMDRYRHLGEYERKHLELEEDRLLSTMLYNLTSFMLMLKADRSEIRKKNRRLLGKSHIGLHCSQAINGLLDNLEKLTANNISLRPPPSRLLQKKSFTVHYGADNKGDMHFMEVCDDCVLLRSVSGVIVDRWWYERLVNMTYSPRTKVLCLWRKETSPMNTQLNKFYTKKCRELYTYIKEAMERAASRGHCKMPGEEIGGEFEAEDMSTGKSGILQIAMDGISFIVDSTKSIELFVELSHVKKCFCKKDGIFIMEVYDFETDKITQRKFSSPVADQIVYSVLCIFSYLAAGHDQLNNESSDIKESSKPATQLQVK